ncbi:hypothetical protein LTS14_006126 [Recurvomyces mirabilis]|uniref:uncharacterized protein n=1 Tax=Recurvomyces mirabilis TaxID=574656 RepID=UPI002DDEDF5D|nr:hypothetical protein LTS14_006126 [Recurvomyces mirabilis]
MSTDALLEEAARDGSLDIMASRARKCAPEAAQCLLPLLARISTIIQLTCRQIVYNDFPIPTIPLPVPLPSTIDPEVVASTPPALLSNHDEPGAHDLPTADENEPPAGSQSSTKENDEPAELAARPPPAAAFEVNRTQSAVQPPDSLETPAGTLPPDLLGSYHYSTRMLEQNFSRSPPYTIQRLAELVLYPRKHYRFLPAYLRALDRTVSVTSPASEFPLPQLTAAANAENGDFLTNGETTQPSERDSLGSDESLGGALLTPIPWLRNNGGPLTGNGNGAGQDGELHSESTETIDGPHGAGSIETVSVTVNGFSSTTASNSHTSPSSPTLSEQSDASSSSSTSLESTDAQLRQQGGVTQGELLRQEQEAGVVPVSQAAPRRSLISGGAAAVGRESASAADVPRDTAADIAMDDRSPEETPHARGPEEIGMEDMGPQQHKIGAVALDMEAAAGRAKSPPAAAQRHPDTPTTQQRVDDVLAALQADAEMQEARQDHAGEAGKDSADVEKEAEKTKEAEDQAKEAEAKDADGDVIVADADGRPVEEAEKQSGTRRLDAPEGDVAASR